MTKEISLFDFLLPAITKLPVVIIREAIPISIAVSLIIWLLSWIFKWNVGIFQDVHVLSLIFLTYYLVAAFGLNKNKHIRKLCRHYDRMQQKYPWLRHPIVEDIGPNDSPSL